MKFLLYFHDFFAASAFFPDFETMFPLLLGADLSPTTVVCHYLDFPFSAVILTGVSLLFPLKCVVFSNAYLNFTLDLV